MAEYGEWNRKGAVLSEVTAQKEYGLTREFIEKGIQGGKLEYRQGAVWGNPYFRILEASSNAISANTSAQNISKAKNLRPNWKPSTRKLGKLRQKLSALELRKVVLQRSNKI